MSALTSTPPVAAKLNSTLNDKCGLTMLTKFHGGRGADNNSHNQCHDLCMTRNITGQSRGPCRTFIALPLLLHLNVTIVAICDCKYVHVCMGWRHALRCYLQPCLLHALSHVAAMYISCVPVCHMHWRCKSSEDLFPPLTPHNPSKPCPTRECVDLLEHTRCRN